MFNFNIINKSRIRITLKDMQNADDIEKRLLDAGAIIPACPIGQCVYRYDPIYRRVLRFIVAELRVSSDTCAYDLECYENNQIITYQTLEERDFGTRFFLSRSAAKRNMNILNEYEAALIQQSIDKYMKEKLTLIYKVSGEAYFHVNQTNKLLSLRIGVKLLSNHDHSEEFQALIEKIKGDIAT